MAAAVTPQAAFRWWRLCEGLGAGKANALPDALCAYFDDSSLYFHDVSAEQLAAAVRRLREAAPDLAELVRMRMEGQSWGELAARRHCARSSVRYQVAAACRALARYVAEEETARRLAREHARQAAMQQQELGRSA